MVNFSCQCGQTISNKRLPDCVSCPSCGTKLIPNGGEDWHILYSESYTPIEHHWCERESGKEECKRCNTPKPQ